MGLSGYHTCFSCPGKQHEARTSMFSQILFRCRQILTKLKGCILLFRSIFRPVCMILYLIYRYIQTRSCRRRGCPRHQVCIYKGQRSKVPRALCIDRRRSLTPRPPSTRRKWLHNLMDEIIPRKRRYHQLQSPLFSVLPAEIRRIVYRHAIGGLTVHVFDMDGRLVSMPLMSVTGTEKSGLQIVKYAPLALLKTCRKVWTIFQYFHS